jgi:hypothetical protein
MAAVSEQIQNVTPADPGMNSQPLSVNLHSSPPVSNKFEPLIDTPWTINQQEYFFTFS